MFEATLSTIHLNVNRIGLVVTALPPTEFGNFTIYAQVVKTFLDITPLLHGITVYL